MNDHTRIIQYLSLCLLLFMALSCASMPKAVRTEFEEPKSALFTSTQKLMERAVSERADDFAPYEYAKAVQYYQNAEEDFEKGEDTAEIQKNLEKAEKYAFNSIDLAKTMRHNFPELVESRDKAIEAGADKMDLRSYKRGEKYFLETSNEIQKKDLVGYYLGTTSEVERKDIDNVQKMAQKAQTEFRKAELEAIQHNMTGSLEKQLKEAENKGAKKWTPETYATAEEYLHSAVETLEEDRYNQQKAQQEVDKGEYYARKAMFLTEKIKEAKGDKTNWEQMFLEREEDLRDIAMPLDIEPSFDEGFEEPVNEIDEAVKELKEREQALNRQLKQAEMSLAQAREQMYEAERKKEKIPMTESTLREKRLMEEKLKKVQDIFPSDKAKVTADPEMNIIITLTGLNFDFGKSELKSEYHPLMTDVHKAAQMFPDRKIRFAGHTDSLGSAEFNKRLSLERAKSVAEYMKDTFGMPANRIEVVGAGESEPIAPNTTPEGRKLNRRIDVIFLAP